MVAVYRCWDQQTGYEELNGILVENTAEDNYFWGWRTCQNCRPKTFFSEVLQVKVSGKLIRLDNLTSLPVGLKAQYAPASSNSWYAYFRLSHNSDLCRKLYEMKIYYSNSRSKTIVNLLAVLLTTISENYPSSKKVLWTLPTSVDLADQLALRFPSKKKDFVKGWSFEYFITTCLSTDTNSIIGGLHSLQRL